MPPYARVLLLAPCLLPLRADPLGTWHWRDMGTWTVMERGSSLAARLCRGQRRVWEKVILCCLEEDQPEFEAGVNSVVVEQITEMPVGMPFILTQRTDHRGSERLVPGQG